MIIHFTSWTILQSIKKSNLDHTWKIWIERLSNDARNNSPAKVDLLGACTSLWFGSWDVKNPILIDVRGVLPLISLVANTYLV